MSLPAWECGLKWLEKLVLWRNLLVTPCVGVWIEIFKSTLKVRRSNRSLPAWECGLKYCVKGRLNVWYSSLPAWECGLKSIMNLHKI